MQLNPPPAHLPYLAQLEEANTLLRAESEAATRLRKTQTESSKQLQQLEANVRELQDKCCLLERGKLSLEKECISLQAALEMERREHSQGSETISDLMGGCHAVFNTRLMACEQYLILCIEISTKVTLCVFAGFTIGLNTRLMVCLVHLLVFLQVFRADA